MKKLTFSYLYSNDNLWSKIPNIKDYEKEILKTQSIFTLGKWNCNYQQWMLVLDENNNLCDLDTITFADPSFNHRYIEKLIRILDKYTDLEIDSDKKYIISLINDFRKNTISKSNIEEFIKNEAESKKYLIYIEHINQVIWLLLEYKKLDTNENNNLYKKVADVLFDIIIEKEKKELLINIDNESDYYYRKESRLHASCKYFMNYLSPEKMDKYLDFLLEVKEKRFLNKNNYYRFLTLDFNNIGNAKSEINLRSEFWNKNYTLYADKYFKLIQKHTTKGNFDRYLSFLNLIFYNSILHTKSCEYVKQENTEFINYYKQNSKYLKEITEFLSNYINKFKIKDQFMFMFHLIPDEFNWSLFDRYELLSYFPEGFETSNFSLKINKLNEKYEGYYKELEMGRPPKVFYTFISLVEKSEIESQIEYICTHLLNHIATSNYYKDLDYLLDANNNLINEENIKYIIENLTKKINEKNKVQIFRNYIYFLKDINSIKLLNIKDMNTKFRKTYMETQLGKN